MGLDIVEMKSADLMDTVKAMGLTAVGGAATTYLVGTRMGGGGSQLEPSGKIASTLLPFGAKFIALSALGMSKGTENIVKNSMVLDLAVGYGNYIVPKVEEYVLTGSFTLPGSESFGNYEGAGREIAALQSEIAQLEAPAIMPQAEAMLSPAVALSESQRTTTLIG